MRGGWQPPTGRLGEMVGCQRARRDLFRRRLEALPPAPPGSTRPALREALEEARLGLGRLPLIAEVKRRSPSAGAIAPGRDAVEQAARYAAGGAAAVSVLANDAFFGGSPDDVRAVSSSPRVRLPVLYKDIVVWPEQVELAWRCGASAVLLIAAALAPDEVASLMAHAAGLGLEAVVEVHDEAELEQALALQGLRILGVNNRDLRTFEVDPGRALRLLPRVPPGVLRLAESGYRTPAEVAAAWQAGADAVLVGEALMRAAEPEAFLAELRDRWRALSPSGGRTGATAP